MESHCIEYAADSEDEEWLLTNINTCGQDRLSSGNFEKLIWKLEMANSMVTQHTLRKAGKMHGISASGFLEVLSVKGASMMERKSKGSSAFVQHLTKVAAVKLLKKHEGFESAVIERVYEYWTRKRRTRREPLLRTLQPKTAANDRDPDHTFREREKVKRPNTRRRRHVNRSDNIEEKLNEIKDEMGHACNIFRSMINRESIKAHVVNVYIAQKRLLLNNLSGKDHQEPSGISEIQKDLTKKERYLKKDDAEYRAKVCRFLLQNVFHGHLRKMFASARGTEGEGGCDGAVWRRLRKGQKRRQKVISFLVQDRNWQKWHDKSWMQKMYVILKKRNLLGDNTRFINQKRVWKKWESFVKCTRDRSIRRIMELTQKRKHTSLRTNKLAKPSKSPIRSTPEMKNESGKASDFLRKKTPSRPETASSPETKGSTEDISLSDPVSTDAIVKSTMSWAQSQGVVPPVPPNASKTISIPSAFVVPQDGFSCLPPRLKEMYAEAEKDATNPPESVSEKIKVLKMRRRRIQQSMADQELERDSAVAQFNQEWKESCDSEEKKVKMKELKQAILHHRVQTHEERVQSTWMSMVDTVKEDPCPSDEVSSAVQLATHAEDKIESPVPNIEMSPDVLTIDNYAVCRHDMLKWLKQKLSQMMRRGLNLHVTEEPPVDIRNILDSFWRLKSAKLPDLPLLKALLEEFSVSKERLPEALGESLSSLTISKGNEQANGVHRRKRARNRTNAKLQVNKSGQEADSFKSSNGQRKRVTLMKRKHRRLVLEIRMAGQRKIVDLKPEEDAQFNPFLSDSHELDTRQLEAHLTSKNRLKQEPTQLTEQNPGETWNGEGTSTALLKAEEELARAWNGLYSRDGPIAQVPVHSHRMIKAQSAPILVTTEEPYSSGGNHKSKASRKKAVIGMGASKRLLKGKSVSVSALRKRQRLRRQILKPFMPKMMTPSCLSKTKLRKIMALLNVKMQVPSRPERRPLFSHAFKLGQVAQMDKTLAGLKSSACPAADIASSGHARIGRGNRVWIDRVDPLTMQRPGLEDKLGLKSVDGMRPMIWRVLKADRKKRRIIKKQWTKRSLSKREREEKKLQKLNQMKEIASQLANRQQNFLPHCVLQTRTESADSRRQEENRPNNVEAEAGKEAQKLYGTAIEMGIELPLDHLHKAAVAALSPRSETDCTMKAKLMRPSSADDVMHIATEKAEPMDRLQSLGDDGQEQSGVKVIFPPVTSMEESSIFPVATDQVMSPLGNAQLGQVPGCKQEITGSHAYRIARAASDSFVDVDYLTRIAPRRPRTSMEQQHATILRDFSKSSVGEDLKKNSASYSEGNIGSS